MGQISCLPGNHLLSELFSTWSLVLDSLFSSCSGEFEIIPTEADKWILIQVTDVSVPSWQRETATMPADAGMKYTCSLQGIPSDADAPIIYLASEFVLPNYLKKETLFEDLCDYLFICRNHCIHAHCVSIGDVLKGLTC